VSIRIESLPARGGDALPFEIVERKGVGHPDTIADAIAESVSLALCRYYRNAFGRILHHNVDKSLLWGGAAESAFGGGRVLKPMELFVAGRATAVFEGQAVPIDAIVVDTARQWFRSHLPLIDVDSGIKFHSLIRAGSADLVALFERQQRSATALSNDTSIGVGFAPQSRLESAVDRVARRLNDPRLRDELPELGPDIKVMGIRDGEAASFTIAVAFVDRYVRDAKHYLERKTMVEGLVRDVAAASGFGGAAVVVNAGDDEAQGSFYLTVTGTSAEAGDDGQAGRGNRVNGLITPFRPMSIESVAGKNPVTHVGKLYNITAGLIAQAIVDEVPEIAEAHCHLVSQIGQPIASPHLVSVFASPREGGGLASFEDTIRRVVATELGRIGGIAAELLEGSIALDRWPLRREQGGRAAPAFSVRQRQLMDEIADDARHTAEHTGRAKLSPRTMAAIAKVPREAFVGADDREAAYLNMPLSIGYGQTISQPFIVALMTDLLDLEGEERVLEIGTGSGYQAAILSELARAVYSIEVVEPLAREAAARLAGLGYRNVEVKAGDGAKGWAEHAPFDAIIVTAAGRSIPPDLVAQLRAGGRMVMPVGPRRGPQNLIVLTKDDHGRVRERAVLPVSFVALV